MKSRIRTLFFSGVLAVSGLLAAGALSSVPALAACEPADSPKCAAQRGVNATGTQNNTCGDDGKSACGLADVIKTVINVLLFIIGALSVIMIIIGGIKYVISNGDSSQITSAKNTIMYAVIGLVIALLAYAIVNFVVTQFT